MRAPPCRSDPAPRVPEGPATERGLTDDRPPTSSTDRLNSIARSPSHRSALAHYAELARIGKALASPVRLQLLDLLRQGPRTVQALADAARLPVANASQHLQHLRRARLVTGDRDGQRIEYALSHAAVSLVFGAIRDVAEALLPEMDRLRVELRALGAGAREDLLARIRVGGVTLLDVRPVEEYRAGHLPGAISIPLAELTARAGELPRGREVIAYCRGPYCAFAVEAVAVLGAAGLVAHHLDLGVPDLRARRFRIVTGDQPRSPRTKRGPAVSPRTARTPR